MENEFGDVSIDSMLIKSDDIIEINSGCICCGLKSDFKEIIHKIDKDQFEYIIIEPTGIAKLTDILDVLKEEEKAYNPKMRYYCRLRQLHLLSRGFRRIFQ